MHRGGRNRQVLCCFGPVADHPGRGLVSDRARGLVRRSESEILRRIEEDRLLVAYLVTEPHAGSDVASIGTSARRDGGDYVISGTKCFATNGGVAAVYTVLGTHVKRRRTRWSFFLPGGA